MLSQCTRPLLASVASPACQHGSKAQPVLPGLQPGPLQQQRRLCRTVAVPMYPVRVPHALLVVQALRPLVRVRTRGVQTPSHAAAALVSRHVCSVRHAACTNARAGQPSQRAEHACSQATTSAAALLHQALRSALRPGCSLGGLQVCACIHTHVLPSSLPDTESLAHSTVMQRAERTAVWLAERAR